MIISCVLKSAGQFNSGHPQSEQPDLHVQFEAVAIGEGHDRVERLAGNTQLFGQGCLTIPTRLAPNRIVCEALRGGLFARAARIFAAEARGNSAGKVRTATADGLDKESRIHSALPQVTREEENVSTGCVNAVAHRGNLDARFAC